MTPRSAMESAAVDDPRIEIPITDTLDLHPFHPAEIADVGIGVQRERIRSLLRESGFVVGFQKKP